MSEFEAGTFAPFRPKGSTRLFGVLGDPVVQVMAPTLMNELFAERNVDAVLVPIQVAREHLASVLESLKRIGNLDGLLVTVPHKFSVCDHLDHLGEAAALAGSANALRREPDGTWTGENFDGVGFVRGLQAAGRDPSGARVSLIGAGGAGVSIAAALLVAGAASLSITDLDPGRMDGLVRRLAAKWPGRVQASAEANEACDIIVNATPLGLRESDPLPFHVATLAPDVLVADIIMKPAKTRLLEAATARGLAVHPGIPMLVEQVELYRRFFRIP
ncbi:shikimate dehydrogenase family protein [Azospirillum endophyticum]